MDEFQRVYLLNLEGRFYEIMDDFDLPARGCLALRENEVMGRWDIFPFVYHLETTFEEDMVVTLSVRIRATPPPYIGPFFHNRFSSATVPWEEIPDTCRVLARDLLTTYFTTCEGIADSLREGSFGLSEEEENEGVKDSYLEGIHQFEREIESLESKCQMVLTARG